MKKLSMMTLGIATLFAATGCAPLNPGVPGDPAITNPAIDGTVFTIIFENENAHKVLSPEVPYFYELSQKYGNANAYISDTHPSLVNYIMMTSGSTQGITTDDDPGTNKKIKGKAHLAEQLDAAGVKWRAYMEDMGEPCKMTSTDLYAVRHNPFLYYTSLAEDKERCNDRVVDYDQFDADLATGQYQYMWITPNTCNDMHDCSAQVADEWLSKVIPKIMASDAYKNNGVIFVIFDEGEIRLGNAGADVPAIVISPQLVSEGYQTDTRFDHRSYLATIEDIFGMPRLATTKDAVPMGEFFVQE